MPCKCSVFSKSIIALCGMCLKDDDLNIFYCIKCLMKPMWCNVNSVYLSKIINLICVVVNVYEVYKRIMYLK